MKFIEGGHRDEGGHLDEHVFSKIKQIDFDKARATDFSNDQ